MAKSKKRDEKFSIPDTGRNVMRAIASTTPKKAHEWKYLKRESK